ncbi:MAG: VCBS repeat-containing protein [Planctomycetes bacterium]|nr:VCBS repeat-containing protein [Planctomycetota bacterium]
MRALALFVSSFVIPVSAQAQTLNVVGLSPTMNATNVLPGQALVVDFDRALNPSTLPPNAPHLHLFGSVTGAIAGALTLENGNQRLRFTPTKPFVAGEIVSAELDRFVQAQDGSFLRQGGWSWSFRIRAGSALRSFQVIDVMTTRTIPSVPATVYGGATSDFNGDGFVDIGGVCENSSDVRLFVNRADGTGLFLPFHQPTYPVGSTPSPNDPADIDGDGKTDLVTCNTAGTSISVLPGNGDGTFGLRTDWSVGSAPHGLALLDVDGDGDLDIATSNTGTDNVCVIHNNGTGSFGAPTFFEGGGSGEYALCAGDMNNDGLMDLVVGARSSSLVIVHLNNGAGGFVMQPAQNAGGGVWMMQAGDLNGDGKLDVSCANGGSGNASVLLGNGDGTLQAPQVVPGGSHTVATDLGDLDGDGDLDWVVSCFGGSIFEVYVNNGAGVFAFDQSFNALSNSSCAALVDIDNDLDLDLDILLFEETGDWIQVLRNLDVPFEIACQPGLLGVSACPCANPPSATNRGCDNSSATGGAILAGSGTPSLAADTLHLSASDEKPTATSVVLQGNAILPSGTVFGQGVRCVGGTLKRLYVKTAVAGGINAPGAGDPSISARSAALGAAILAGQHRWYCVYYRDATVLGSCHATSTFNTTPTLEASWVP